MFNIIKPKTNFKFSLCNDATFSFVIKIELINPQAFKFCLLTRNYKIGITKYTIIWGMKSNEKSCINLFEKSVIISCSKK